MGYRWKGQRWVSDEEFQKENDSGNAFIGTSFVTLLVGGGAAAVVHVVGVRLGLGETVRFWLVVVGGIAGMVVGHRYHGLIGNILATVVGLVILSVLACITLGTAYQMYTGKNGADQSSEAHRTTAFAPPSPDLPSPAVVRAEPVRPARVYCVVGTPDGGSLDVLSWPGANDEVTARLPNGYSGVYLIGTSEPNGKTGWVHIGFGECTGWVKKQYLRVGR